MFDLDMIEAEWKSFNLKLDEQQIFEIYKSEGVTLEEYQRVLKEFADTRPEYPVDDSAECRLLREMFYGD